MIPIAKSHLISSNQYRHWPVIHPTWRWAGGKIYASEEFATMSMFPFIRIIEVKCSEANQNPVQNSRCDLNLSRESLCLLALATNQKQIYCTQKRCRRDRIYCECDWYGTLSGTWKYTSIELEPITICASYNLFQVNWIFIQ